MAVINTNIGAIKAANASNTANKMLGTAMERLSTGKRINSAKDDAAGLAIATTMTAQVRGMGQAIRNANDGIGLAQTADGGLNEVTNMLQRVRELAVQSKSGTYQQADRDNLQAEVTQLTSQIDDILTNTKFNGVTLFGKTGSSSDVTVTIQAGSDTGNTIDLKIKGIDGTKVNATALDVTNTTKSGTTITNVDAALTAVNTTRASLRRWPEPPRIGRQQPDHQRGQPVRRPQPHRRRRLFGRDDRARQGSDHQPGVDGDALAGQPEPAERPVAAALSKTEYHENT